MRGREERRRARAHTERTGYTWLPHWPLRCPPVSNAIINYLAVGSYRTCASLSFSFSLSFVCSHTHTRSFSSAPTYSVSLSSLHLFLSLSFLLSFSVYLTATKPLALHGRESRLTREKPSRPESGRRNARLSSDYSLTRARARGR